MLSMAEIFEENAVEEQGHRSAMTRNEYYLIFIRALFAIASSNTQLSMSFFLAGQWHTYLALPFSRSHIQATIAITQAKPTVINPTAPNLTITPPAVKGSIGGETLPVGDAAPPLPPVGVALTDVPFTPHEPKFFGNWPPTGTHRSSTR